MLILDVLDDDRRETFIDLVHDTSRDRSGRAAAIAAAGGELVRG